MISENVKNMFLNCFPLILSRADLKFKIKNIKMFARLNTAHD